MERQDRARGPDRSCRLQNSLGTWLPPTTDLLPACVAARRGRGALNPGQRGAVPAQAAGSAPYERELELGGQPLQWDPAAEGSPCHHADAEQHGSQGLQQQCVRVTETLGRSVAMV